MTTKLDAKKVHESLLLVDSILYEVRISNKIRPVESALLKKHLKLLHKYFDLEIAKNESNN